MVARRKCKEPKLSRKTKSCLKTSDALEIDKILTSRLESLAKDYHKKKVKYEELEKELNSLRSDAIAIMQQMNIDTYDSKKVRVRCSSSTRSYFKSNCFKIDYPELYESYSYLSTRFDFRVKRK